MEVLFVIGNNTLGQCEGDSGMDFTLKHWLLLILSSNNAGPLVLSTGTGPTTPVVQVGVVSWSIKAEGCAGQQFPGVYTRFSEMARWIESTVCDHTGELREKRSKTIKVAK